MSRLNGWARKLAVPLACDALLLAIAIVIGMHNVRQTGFLWADAPRYANGAAMIHDWLLSGQWTQPYEFAKGNYFQYPGFNIPSHPPVYPGLMAIFFLAFGMSYVTARLFIAVCLGLAAVWFVRILMQVGASRTTSVFASVLMMTTPGIAYWSRTTMSEIPSLMLILLATWQYLVWLNTQKARHCWLAFFVAGLAFLSRITSAGVLPAWFLFALATRRYRLLFSPHNIAASLLYLLGGLSWVRFAVQFGKYENGGELSHLRPEYLMPEKSLLANMLYHPSQLSQTVGWPALVCGMAATGLLYWAVKKKRCVDLWILAVCWYVSYWMLQLVISLNEHNEPRYFCLGLPSVVILVAALLSWGFGGSRWSRVVAVFALVACLANNAVALSRIPRGVVGYDRTAQVLANCKRPGNILTASPRDQDLIFRYRAVCTDHSRLMIRSDRSLTIRAPDYVAVEAKRHAFNAEQMIDTLRRGRVRYLITSSPPDKTIDERYEEMEMAHTVATSHPEDFRLVDKSPLVIQLGGEGRTNYVFVWEYLGELPPGPSELSIPIPTANIVLPPREAAR